MRGRGPGWAPQSENQRLKALWIPPRKALHPVGWALQPRCDRTELVWERALGQQMGQSRREVKTPGQRNCKEALASEMMHKQQWGAEVMRWTRACMLASALPCTSSEAGASSL